VSTAAPNLSGTEAKAISYLVPFHIASDHRFNPTDYVFEKNLFTQIEKKKNTVQIRLQDRRQEK
jgi:hypothetical protein